VARRIRRSSCPSGSVITNSGLLKKIDWRIGSSLWPGFKFPANDARLNKYRPRRIGFPADLEPVMDASLQIEIVRFGVSFSLRVHGGWNLARRYGGQENKQRWRCRGTVIRWVFRFRAIRSARGPPRLHSMPRTNSRQLEPTAGSRCHVIPVRTALETLSPR
jgi:hypothetical protein